MLLFESLVTDSSKSISQVKARVEIDLERIIIKQVKGNYTQKINRNSLVNFKQQEINVTSMRFLEKALKALILEYESDSNTISSLELIFMKEKEFSQCLDIMNQIKQFQDFYISWKDASYQRLLAIRKSLHDQLDAFPTNFKPAKFLKKKSVTDVFSGNMQVIDQLKEYFEGQVENFKTELQAVLDEYEKSKQAILTQELHSSAAAIIRKDINVHFESTKNNCEIISRRLDELVKLNKAITTNEKETQSRTENLEKAYIEFQRNSEGYRLKARQLLEFQEEIDKVKDLVAERFSLADEYDEIASNIGSEIYNLLSQLVSK